MSQINSILLFCLKMINVEKNESFKTINILNIFQAFGEIKKIILFSNKNIIKAFIEFSNTLNAKLAKETCDKCFLCNEGNIRIFYSSIRTLCLKNKFIEYYNVEKNILINKNSLKNQFKEKCIGMVVKHVSTSFFDRITLN